ncbi:hypothetical protein L198_01586 [Cryptococcus wingfieldii CBS 7118]|uniref:Uncharacterized protein n=1 Tax=Cryptococcus wingfieldii CBS 7118 TaxID=1295528 RepID=A0A1E3JZQ0_9TREE|nr:hypothetical protein L198_01586 [Cryptococcus wingfieldii CBS 7118]ODO06354.1 hypothetical protein L198_01586 [Cryptococcus wingfieldii CBS 7118]
MPSDTIISANDSTSNKDASNSRSSSSVAPSATNGSLSQEEESTRQESLGKEDTPNASASASSSGMRARHNNASGQEDHRANEVLAFRTLSKEEREIYETMGIIFSYSYD